jgi:hypothetical protein
MEEGRGGMHAGQGGGLLGALWRNSPPTPPRLVGWLVDLLFVWCWLLPVQTMAHLRVWLGPHLLLLLLMVSHPHHPTFPYTHTHTPTHPILPPTLPQAAAAAAAAAWWRPHLAVLWRR